MEYFDLRNPDGTKTGERKERTQVHRDGDLHATVHIWIARQNPDTGQAEILLQKRSAGKDSFPGCYDISCAGHIAAGDEELPTALRELGEELGIQAAPEELTFLFSHTGYMEKEFNGELFKNYECSNVYVYTKHVEAEALNLQEEEVESVAWMALESCSRQVHLGNPAYCIFPDEIEELCRKIPEILACQEDAVKTKPARTWAEDAQQDLEEWIEEQGIYIRQ